MKRIDDWSIRAKLIGAFAPLLSAVVLFYVLYFPARQYEDGKSALLAKGRSLAQLIAHDAAAAFDFGDATSAAQVFEGASNDPDLEFILLAHADGKPFASHHPEKAPSDLQITAVDAVRERVDDERVIVLAPVVPTDGAHGVLVAGFSTRGLVAASRKNRLAAMLIGLVVLGLALLLTLFVSNQVGRRLSRFAALAETVAQGSLDAGGDLDSGSDDEIGRLSRSLHAMVGQLRSIVERIRGASAKVATSASRISKSSRDITNGAQAQVKIAERTAHAMSQIAGSIETIAEGTAQLALHVDETSASISEMGASTSQMAQLSETLAGVVSETGSTIEQMTVSSEKVARSLADLAHTVSGTTATVEEMAAFVASVTRNAETLSQAAQRAGHRVADMAAAIQRVAKIAEEADLISREASEDAQRGDLAVSTLVDGMKKISSSMENTSKVIVSLGGRSRQIGKVLEVIEDIADQTNLLALNAAIEAARAGEAGRGFGVVADEVRKLAERSVDAAKEIAELVREVQSETAKAVEAATAGAVETQQGITRADAAGEALRRILSSVVHSTELMAQIASATAQQSEASAEVLRTMGDMGGSTDQVTSAVREQAESTKVIREAMDSINKVMSQVAAATREQAAGGRRVREAVDNMNRIASQVNTATREQAEESLQIVGAASNMSQRTQQVSAATTAQRQRSAEVVHAMENIGDVARSHLSSVEELSNASNGLAEQAQELESLIAVFRA